MGMFALLLSIFGRESNCSWRRGGTARREGIGSMVTDTGRAIIYIIWRIPSFALNFSFRTELDKIDL